MDTEVKTISINGVEYVRKDSVNENEMAEKVEEKIIVNCITRLEE